VEAIVVVGVEVKVSVDEAATGRSVVLMRGEIDGFCSR
jgi:hypothetical protein